MTIGKRNVRSLETHTDGWQKTTHHLLKGNASLPVELTEVLELASRVDLHTVKELDRRHGALAAGVLGLERIPARVSPGTVQGQFAQHLPSDFGGVRP